MPGSRRYERTLQWTLLALVVAVVVGLAVAVTSGATRCDRFEFDASAWGGPDAPSRAHVADDLIDCNTLAGDSKGEVLRKLGTPDFPRAGRRSSRRVWRYDVSYGSGYFSDYRVSLEVRFDRAGRVAAVRRQEERVD